MPPRFPLCKHHRHSSHHMVALDKNSLISFCNPLVSTFQHYRLNKSFFLPSIKKHLHSSTSNSTALDPSHPTIPEAIRELELTRVPAGTAVYSRLLDACTRSKSLIEGKIVHRHIVHHNAHIRNAALLEKLTLLYLSCGEHELAHQVFDTIPRPVIFLWNSLIRAYAWNGPLDRAIDLYHVMVSSGVVPNKFTFPFVLKACSGLKALEDGMEIHRNAETVGLDVDVFVATAVIDMYMKCGCLEESRRMFLKMSHRDIVAWNAMIAGLSLHGRYDDVVDFVSEMQRMGVAPNSSTIVSILPVIGQEKALAQVKGIHGFSVRRSLENGDVVVATAILDAYGKCECANYSKGIFQTMMIKNEVTWSAMIEAYVLCDQLTESLQLFKQMLAEGSWNLTSTTLACALRACAKLTDLTRGKMLHGYLNKTGFSSDLRVGNTILSMYAKCGYIDDAVGFFNEMLLRDTVSYGAIISGCVQNGNAKDALHFFKKMRMSNEDMDIATMAGVVPACSHLAALQHGKCSHSCTIILGFASDTSLCNALIDMYSKCGRIDYARKVFDRMLKHDIVSWNSIVLGFGAHGLGDEALLLFDAMQACGQKPDDVTFICLLSACSHSGLVAEGRRLFQAMTHGYNINPRMEHYVCMVDLLGRAGLLEEAQCLIRDMPFDADIHVWGALLGACRVHKDVNLAEDVSIKIRELGTKCTGNFVLLSNIYSAAGRFDEAEKIRILQRHNGLKKSPGCSWIEVRGVVHAFVGGDQSHPLSSKIYEVLRELVVKMKKLGYNADISFVLQNVEEEEKEHALLYHSEKLAVAFGIISLGIEQPILVTKNLRICGDCHSAIKFITIITKRAISVRDANRFHHFKDGLCNCGDFW